MFDLLSRDTNMILPQLLLILLTALFCLSAASVDVRCGEYVGVLTHRRFSIYDQFDYNRRDSPDEGYPPNLDCTWSVRVRPGNVIYLRLEEFDLEYSDFCEFDSLTVFDGSTRDAPVIGKFCGSERPMPPAIRTSTDTVTFRFKTDSSVSRSGFFFFIHERTVCGGDLTEETGVITPPEDDTTVECIWTVQVPEDKVIKVNFEEILMDNSGNFDNPDIIDGDRETGLTMVHLVGTFHPEFDPDPIDTIEPNLMTTKSKLTVRMYTGFGFGFRLRYSTVNRPCGGIQVVKPGNQVLRFDALNDEIVREESITCGWTLRAESPEERLHLSFNAINLPTDCSTNYFIARDAPVKVFADDKDLRQEFKLCGNTTREDLITMSNEVEIFYKYGGESSQSSFEIGHEIYDCNRTISGRSGIVRSPGFPGYYPNNLNCITKIKADRRNHEITLNFGMIDMETTSDCRYDYLEVFQGDSFNPGHLIAKLCGNKPVKTIVTVVNQLTLRFITDRRTQRRGYDITYTANDGCGGQLDASTGTFSLPHTFIAQHQQGNLTCNWIIDLPSRLKARLEFPHSNLNQHIEDVSGLAIIIRDGGLETSPLIGRYETMNPGMINSTGNQLFVQLVRFRRTRRIYYKPYPYLPHDTSFTAIYTSFDPAVPEVPEAFDYEYQWYFNGFEDAT